MAILQILKYPNPILRKKAEALKEITEEDKCLIGDMIDTMKAVEGVGLAANQIGVSKRIFVFNSSVDEWRADVLINPIVIKRRGSEKMEEGCLSLPGISEEVRRSNYILVEGRDVNGKPVRFEATGLLARIIQHEIDHLNGILLIDRINLLRRIRALRQLKGGF
ncbi:MAG: peptide deformylase [Candidatus Omnitrophota bacterium]